MRSRWLAALAAIHVLSASDTAAAPKNHERTFGKILGGRLARHGKFPFMLSLEEYGASTCGAAAIERYWAVTAAHCVKLAREESSAADLRLRSGTVVRETGGTEHRVAKIVTHPGFGQSAFGDDIALLKLQEPFNTTSYVKLLRMPGRSDSLQEGSNVTAMGWGYTSADLDGEVSEELKEVTLVVQSDGECESKPFFEMLRVLLRLKDNVFVKGKMFCAWSASSDTAHGDSGGPVVVGAGPDAVLVGLVSWGAGEADPERPGVYTRVSNYTDWITDTLRTA